ncbi:MAG: sulfatase [Gemmataceae bacterium]
MNASGLLAALGLLLAGVSPGRPPNIVVVLADDLGWADLACQGGDLHETPHIDRLAKEGVRFTRAYSASPVCSPTRCALLTGMHPARLGMTIWREGAASPPSNRKWVPPKATEDLPFSIPTLADRLKTKGYATALVGKWHLGGPDHFPENHGFDVNLGGNHWGAPPTFFAPYKGLFGQSREPRYVPGLPYTAKGEYLTDRLTKEAIGFIDQVGDSPFFLLLAHYAPHTPIQAKPGLVEKYQQKIAPGLHHQNPVYAAMVHSLDESVGQVMDHLRNRGLVDNTLVVFTSDNGGYIGEYQDRQVTTNHPLRSGKGSVYEGGIRVPLLVRYPGISVPGKNCDTPVVTMDLFHTLAQATGLPNPGTADSKSLMDLLKNPAKPAHPRDLFWHYPHYYPTTTPVGAALSGDWKVLEYFEDARVELFDLAEDPFEKNNLATQNPTKAAECLEKLRAWQKQAKVSLPVPNPKFKAQPVGN